MAPQLLALVTVNWLFSKAIKMFYSPVCAGDSARVHTCDETELPMPSEHSRTPIPLQLGVIFLRVCFCTPSSLNQWYKDNRAWPCFASPDLLTFALDVLRFLFMIRNFVEWHWP